MASRGFIAVILLGLLALVPPGCSSDGDDDGCPDCQEIPGGGPFPPGIPTTRPASGGEMPGGTSSGGNATGGVPMGGLGGISTGGFSTGGTLGGTGVAGLGGSFGATGGSIGATGGSLGGFQP